MNKDDNRTVEIPVKELENIKKQVELLALLFEHRKSQNRVTRRNVEREDLSFTSIVKDMLWPF